MHPSVSCTEDCYCKIILEVELSVHGEAMCVELIAPRMSSIFAFCDSLSRTSSTTGAAETNVFMRRVLLHIVVHNSYCTKRIYQTNRITGAIQTVVTSVINVKVGWSMASSFALR